MTRTFELLSDYKIMNNYADNKQIVFVGIGSFENLNLNELIEDYNINRKLYNRSCNNLKLKDAEKYFKDYIYELAPSAIIISLGESEIESSAANTEELVEQFKWLLYNIHIHLADTKIYVAATPSKHPKTNEFNSLLKCASIEYGCTFLDSCYLTERDNKDISIFKSIKNCFLDTPLNFAEAVTLSRI